MSAVSAGGNPRKGSTPKILSLSSSTSANLVLRTLIRRVGDAARNMIVSRTQPEIIESTGAVRREQPNISSPKGVPGPEYQWVAGIGMSQIQLQYVEPIYPQY
jgi:hypothetical protein